MRTIILRTVLASALLSSFSLFAQTQTSITDKAPPTSGWDVSRAGRGTPRTVAGGAVNQPELITDLSRQAKATAAQPSRAKKGAQPCNCPPTSARRRAGPSRRSSVALVNRATAGGTVGATSANRSRSTSSPTPMPSVVKAPPTVQAPAEVPAVQFASMPAQAPSLADQMPDERVREQVVVAPYPYTLPIDKQSIKGAYVMGISDHKTTHIIFSGRIKDFDAGSADVLAFVPEQVGNILRVKANEGRPFKQTNMTVITETGELYSFLVHYDPDPAVLTFNVTNNQLLDEAASAKLGINRSNATVHVVPDGATGTPALDELQLFAERVSKQKEFIRNVGATRLKINVRLTGLYVHNGMLYLQLGIENASEIDYPVDFVKFYIRDKNVLKRVAAQEIELPGQVRYPDITQYKARSEYVQVYSVPVQTFTEEKVLEVEMYEQQGGRHIRFQIESDIFIKARSL